MSAVRFHRLFAVCLVTLFALAVSTPASAVAESVVIIEIGTRTVPIGQLFCKPENNAAYIMTYTYRNVWEITTKPTGGDSFIYKLNFSFTLIPETTGSPTYIGHYSSILRGSYTPSPEDGLFRLQATWNIQGTGDDGSTFKGVLQSHLILTASNATISTYKLLCQ